MRVILTEMGAMTAKTRSLPGVAFVGALLGSGMKENGTLAVSYACPGTPEIVQDGGKLGSFLWAPVIGPFSGV